MLVLAGVTESIDAVLSGAVTTNQLVCYAAYRDITTTAYTPGSERSVTNDTTDITLVASPAAATQRVIDYASVYNNDTASATVTIKYDIGGTESTLWKGTLAVGEKVEYVEGVGFRVLDNTGVVKGIGATGAAGVDGGGTILGSGTSIIDFGSGAPMATVTVTGETAILAGSLVYCWIKPEATVDHTADEHIIESIKVVASDIVAGDGFTIYGLCPDPAISPERPMQSNLGRYSGTGAATGRGKQAVAAPNPLNRVALLSGKWTVGWFYTQ